MSDTHKAENLQAASIVDESCLLRNLKALGLRQHGLAKRLTLPCETSHLLATDTGDPVYKLRKRRLPLNLPPGALNCLLPNVGGESIEAITLIGVGMGTLAQAILERWPEATLKVWDRDPALMRLALSNTDLSEAFIDGRLQLALGADLRELIPIPEGTLMIEHPLAKALYQLEAKIIHTGGVGIPVGLNLSGLLVEDVAAALREEGYCPWPMAFNGWDIEESRHAIRALSPRFVIAVNYLHGLPEFLESEGVPLKVWEIDPTTEVSPSVKAPCPKTQIFTYRQRNLPGYAAGGFQASRHLPLAANVKRRAPIELSPGDITHYGCDVSFVGSSMVGIARQHRQRFVGAYLAWHPEGQEARAQCESKIEAVLAAQLRAGGNYILPGLMEDLFGDFLAEARERYAPEDPLLWIAEVAAAHRRLMVCCRLGSSGIHLWGDVGWRSLTSQGAHYRGYAAHGDELTKIYCASRINIDLGRLYQPDIVTMRVFDVLACGGFLLAEASDELSSLFEVGREIIAYDDASDLPDLINYYRARPQEAQDIAARGRQAVLERHTIAHRVREILNTLPQIPEA